MSETEMISIPIPGISQELVLSDVAANIRSADLRRRFRSIFPTIREKNLQFHTRMLSGLVYQTAPDPAGVGEVTSGELVEMYDQRFVPGTTRARVHYDQIINSAPNGKCPYCGTRPAFTIDHFLPKAKYSSLSLTVENLVPACSDCNGDKVNEVVRRPEDLYFHPYFERCNFREILQMRVVSLRPPLFEFSIPDTSVVDSVTLERVRMQFRTLKLLKLFSTSAQVEFQDFRGAFLEIFQNEGADSLKLEVERKARSIGATGTLWRYVYYKYLSRDLCFLGGEF